jgi:hypothetical protein
MSAAASPGRTWISFPDQRRLPVLAPTPAAALLYGCDRGARLPAVGSLAPSSVDANVGHEDNPRVQSGTESSCNQRLDRIFYSVPISN